MLRKARELDGFELRAHDGRIGHVRDFFFDDRRWTIRYLVVEAGSWLQHREVLIAPAALRAPEWSERVLPVALTRLQVQQSPCIDSGEPVSREAEMRLSPYYSWPMGWTGVGVGDPLLMPIPPVLPAPSPWGEHAGAAVAALDEQHHIRSIANVRGHRIEATDGEIGHVDDFLIDDATWRVADLIVDTRNWWPGKRVLIAPERISAVGWAESRMVVDLSRDAVRHCPAFDAGRPMEHEYTDQQVCAARKPRGGAG